jgi:hypothetical protein
MTTSYKDTMMRRHAPLLVTLLSLACGEGQKSQTAPSSPLELSAAATFTMRGEVMDTTNLPIAGAQVEVLTGPGAGTVASTDENGRFVMPWTASDSATVRVSREGFHAHQRPVPARVVALRFDLEEIDSPTIVAGMYQMTLTAANECTQLPSVARQRTYRSQVYPTSRVGWFSAELFDGDFPYSSFFSAEIRGEPLRTLRVHIVTEVDWGNPVTSIVERIGPDMLLELTGLADLPLGAHSAAAAFDGTFTVCPAGAAVSSQTPYRCPVQPVTCRSANHRLTLMRQ